MRRALAILLFMPVCAAAQDESYLGFGLDEARHYRQQWTLANWDDGGELTRYVFLNMSEFWPHTMIHRSGPVRGLPPTVGHDVASFITDTKLGELRLQEYVSRTTVDGLIVLHEGRIAFEAYPRMRPVDKHLTMSVSKTFASTLIGILEDRGLIDVAKPVDAYLPEFEGSGWAGVSVRDVLDMASGIDCLQMIAGVYDDPETCYYQFEAALGWLPPTDATATDAGAYVAGLASQRPAGEAFEYSSVNTFVLRWLIERVSGRTYADMLEREIWWRMGAEADALIVAPVPGVPVAASGISAALRDIARFGLLFTPAGRVVGEPVVSDALLASIQRGGRPEIFNAGREEGDERLIAGEAPRHASYQWDFVMDDGDFFKGGYGGQGLYVSPSRDLVVAFFGTMNADGSGHELTLVSRQLATAGLFDRSGPR